MRKKSIVLGATVALIMAIAAPAFASAPVTTPNATYEFDWVDQQNGDLSTLCGFDVYSSGRRAILRGAAPAHPCARGIPFILNIKKPQPGGWGFEMVRRNRHRSVGTACHESVAPGTVNLHIKHTCCRLKRCEASVGNL